MSQTELAKRMGKTLKSVNEILSDSADVAITPDTALQLERTLGLPASFWLKREQAYQEVKARKREREQRQREIGWLDSLPLRDLRRRGYLSMPRRSPEAVREALSFFGVASVECWNLFWSRAEVDYRMSGAFASEVGHLAAWLRCGELEAQKISCDPYDPKTFETALRQIRKLTTAPVEEIHKGIVTNCAEAGVAAVFVAEFPKTHLSGAARWICGGRRPVIQLSLRHKTDDHLWFTFFHEACHILRHGKKGIYVDDKRPEGARIEQEANHFARSILIPEGEYSTFIRDREKFYPEDIQKFARAVGIAPGLVVGRLQFDGFLDRKFCNHLKRRFEFGAGNTLLESL